MKKYHSKISFIIAAVLLVFIPFQALFLELFLNYFRFDPKLSFWLVHWYEPVVVLLFAWSLIFVTANKTKLFLWQKISLSLIFLGLLSILFISERLGRGIEGFRFTLFSLLALFAFSDFSSIEVKKLIKLYLTLSVIVALWAILERFIGAGYWQRWFDLSPTFGYGNFSVGSTPRSDSIFNGPSQLGSYLLLAVFLAGSKITEEKKNAWRYYILFGLFVLAMSYSFSRAALVGCAISLFILLAILVKNWSDRFKIGILAVAMVVIPILTVRLAGNTNESILTHDTSQAGHLDALNVTTKEINKRADQPGKLFVGTGLGTAGPLIIKYQDGVISESWYFQLIIELGIIGFLLWLGLVSSLFSGLVREQKGLLLGLVAVSVTALFLHTFADSPATSLTLFLLIGTSLNRRTS